MKLLVIVAKGLLSQGLVARLRLTASGKMHDAEMTCGAAVKTLQFKDVLFLLPRIVEQYYRWQSHH
eukprot:5990983-Amphidinium_carterae.1